MLIVKVDNPPAERCDCMVWVFTNTTYVDSTYECTCGHMRTYEQIAHVSPA